MEPITRGPTKADDHHRTGRGMSEQPNIRPDEQNGAENEPYDTQAQRGDGQDSVPTEMRRLYESQVKITSKLIDRMDAFDTKLSGIRTDLGILRGSHARSTVLQNLDRVANRLGFQLFTSLSHEDIRGLSQEVAQRMAVPPNELDSFRDADAIIEVANQSGDHEYVALEVSFTVTESDIRRATRNAGYIRDATGVEAYAAVAGVHVLPECEERIDAGETLFYQIPARELDPD